MKKKKVNPSKKHLVSNKRSDCEEIQAIVDEAAGLPLPGEQPGGIRDWSFCTEHIDPIYESLDGKDFAYEVEDLDEDAIEDEEKKNKIKKAKQKAKTLTESDWIPTI